MQCLPKNMSDKLIIFAYFQQKFRFNRIQLLKLKNYDQKIFYRDLVHCIDKINKQEKFTTILGPEPEDDQALIKNLAMYMAALYEFAQSEIHLNQLKWHEESPMLLILEFIQLILFLIDQRKYDKTTIKIFFHLLKSLKIQKTQIEEHYGYQLIKQKDQSKLLMTDLQDFVRNHCRHIGLQKEQQDGSNQQESNLDLLQKKQKRRSICYSEILKNLLKKCQQNRFFQKILIQNYQKHIDALNKANFQNGDPLKVQEQFKILLNRLKQQVDDHPEPSFIIDEDTQKTIQQMGQEMYQQKQNHQINFTKLSKTNKLQQFNQFDFKVQMIYEQGLVDYEYDANITRHFHFN